MARDDRTGMGDEIPEQVCKILAQGGSCGYGACSKAGVVLTWHMGPVYLDYLWGCADHERELPTDLEKRNHAA